MNKLQSILLVFLVVVSTLIVGKLSFQAFEKTPINCRLEEGQTNSKIYTCQSDYGCYVWTSMIYCDDMESEPKVIARTNKDFSNPSSLLDDDAWVGVDYNQNGVLDWNEGFRPTTTKISGCYGIKILNYPKFTIYNHKLYLCVDGEGYLFQPDTNLNINNKLLPTDVDGKNVIKATQSSSLYHCEVSYKLNDNTKELVYEEDVPGYFGIPESKPLELKKGDTIMLNFDAVLYFKEKICEECECTKNVCVGDIGFKTCTNIDPSTGCGVLSNTIQYCDKGKSCIEGECVVPMEFALTLENEYNEQKYVFKPTEKINAKLYVDSKISGIKTVKFILYKDNVVVMSKQKLVRLPLQPGEYIYETLGSLDMGQYKLVVKIGDFSTEKSFSVSDDMVVYATFVDKGRHTTKDPLKIVLDIFDSSGKIRLDIPDYRKNIVVDATLDGEKVDYDVVERQAGEYEYTFIVPKPGLFKATFEIHKYGYPTVKVSKETYIEEPRLVIHTFFKDIHSTGEYNLDFDIVDENGNYVVPDTITVTVKASRTGEKEVLSGRDISGSSGQYTVRYFFDHEDTYKVTIYADKEGYTADTSETIIDIVDVSGAFCGNGKCESGETITNCPQDCGAGTGVSLPIGWLILLGVPLIVILIIVIIIKVKKR